jgi:hypothetical protein
MADDVHSTGLGLSEALWDELIFYIGERKVIPIVGAGLSTVEVDGRTVPTDEYLATQLAKRLSLPLDDLPAPPTLADVARDLARRTDIRLYSEVHTIAEAFAADAKFHAPDPLLKLARITDFKLFVTTTLDTLLEKAIDAVRHEGARTTQSLHYDRSKKDDLSADASDLSVPTVYHLFGTPNRVPGSYVVGDGDLLEFIHKLQSRDSRPDLLFDNLRENHLLLLGGSLPDWLVRLLLRVAKDQKLPNGREQLEILADDRWRGDPALGGFLKNFSPQTTIAEAGGPAFIDELWRRWSAKQPAPAGAAASASRGGGGVIFLSYSRRDAIAADTMRAELKAAGFEVWFDKEDLDAAQWRPAIAEAIRGCAVFMPLLSSNTHRELKDAVFREEWEAALQRDRGMAEKVAFIIPVVVDEVQRRDLDDVPERMRAKNIQMARGGHVTDELQRMLRAALGGRS